MATLWVSPPVFGAVKSPARVSQTAFIDQQIRASPGIRTPNAGIKQIVKIFAMGYGTISTVLAAAARF
jgi:hypothetical protein